MALPFPRRQVIYLFEEAVTPTFFGTNFWTHIATLHEVDAEITLMIGLSPLSPMKRPIIIGGVVKTG